MQLIHCLVQAQQCPSGYKQYPWPSLTQKILKVGIHSFPV